MSPGVMGMSPGVMGMGILVVIHKGAQIIGRHVWMGVVSRCDHGLVGRCGHE